jgi:hypothetical protein
MAELAEQRDRMVDVQLARRGIRDEAKLEIASSRCLFSDALPIDLSSTLYVFDQVQVQKRLLFATWLRA